MGQGHYTAIVWGAIYEWESLNENYDHPVIEKWSEKGVYEDTQVFVRRDGSEYTYKNYYSLSTSYESKPSWLGFMLAESDGNINCRRDFSNPEDEWVNRGLVLIRKTLSLSKITEEINKANPNIIHNAQTAWEQFSVEMMNSGVILPEPEFLLVTDWD